MKGYIKDFRKELNSDIWMMPPLYHRVWQYIKYKVNHKSNKIPMDDDGFLKINPGQHLTSVRTIAKGVGYYEQMKWKEPNPKTVSKILEWLEKQSMITIQRGKGNRQYTLITLLNWDSYQVKLEEGNSEGTAREHPLDINNNELEGFKNEKELSCSNNPFDFYQENFGVINPFMADNIDQWINDLSNDLVIESMKIALKQNKPFHYAEAILKNWKKKNITSLDAVRAAKKEFERSKTKESVDDDGYDYGF